MPNKNGTGPEGKGSRTGRRLGNCITNKDNQTNTPGKGQGLGLRKRVNQ